MAADPLAPNDHTDHGWDARILDELTPIDLALAPLAGRLGDMLTRLRGYDTRFSAALRRAKAGENGWIDRIDLDSCHRVWFQLHEDLIATLGFDRGAELSPGTRLGRTQSPGRPLHALAHRR